MTLGVCEAVWDGVEEGVSVALGDCVRVDVAVEVSVLLGVPVGVTELVGVGVLDAEEDAEELHVEGAVFEYVKAGEGDAPTVGDTLPECEAEADTDALEECERRWLRDTEADDVIEGAEEAEAKLEGEAEGSADDVTDRLEELEADSCAVGE